MKRIISSILILGASVTGVSQNAAAHERSYEFYDSPRHYRVTVHRDHRMPAWLRKKKDFRRWYRRSALRHNHALAWWQIYEIYGLETRYQRHKYHRPAYYANRDYHWYRNYWHERDHRYRHDREKRDGDRRDDRHRDRYRYRD
jgi:hypothetical protein